MSPLFAAALKVLATALFIVGASELAKRSNFAAALIVGLPLTSLLTIVWLYLDTSDAARAGHYSASILWLLPPGCLFLAALPLAIRAGLGFWPGLAVSIVLTALAYWLYALALHRILGLTL
ncbi:MAG: DUF3147 family protein [Rhizomicrobium sp.]